MMHVSAMPYDARERVARPVVARVLCYPARSAVVAARVSVGRGRDLVVIFMSSATFLHPKRAHRNSGRRYGEIRASDKRADSLTGI